MLVHLHQKLSADLSEIQCSWDQTIRLWHLGTGAQLHTLEGHQGAVACVAISPNGQKIVSGSWARTIRVWGV